MIRPTLQKLFIAQILASFFVAFPVFAALEVREADLLEAAPVDAETVVFIQKTDVKVSEESPISENTVKLENGRYKIYSGYPFFATETGWVYTEIATTTKTLFEKAIPATFEEAVWYLDLWPNVKTALADTFAPSTDGVIQRNVGAGATWSSIRTGAGTDAYATQSSATIGWLSNNSGAYTHVMRGILCFDGSTLNDGDIVSAGTLALRTEDAIHTGTPVASYTIAEYTGDGSALTTDDFDYTLHATVSASDDVILSTDPPHYPTKGDVSFSLNSTGKAVVDTTGVFCYSIRTSADLNNYDPGATNDADQRVGFFFSEQTGTADDPVLTVTMITPTPTPSPTATPTPVPGATTTTSTTSGEYDYYITTLLLVIASFLLMGYVIKLKNHYAR